MVILSIRAVFLSVPQSPEEIDKEERPEVDSKKKSNEPGDDTDVFTEKHSENLFQRTEVLAGKGSLPRSTTSPEKINNKEYKRHSHQIAQTQHLCFLVRFLTHGGGE